MKKLTVFLMILPGLAAAHGGHAPVPEPVHAASHAGPILGALVLAMAIGLALARRVRS